MAEATAAPPTGEHGRWHAKPALALAIKVVATVSPMAIGLIGGIVLGRVLPRPVGWPQTIVWWLGITALSTVLVWVVDKGARRLLPLAALFKLSLVFPDQAPSRYSLALRTGSVKQLERRVDDARHHGLGGEPVEAAARILELAASLNLHDHRTRGHSERVRALADLLAEELKLPREDRERLHWAALLHDVGKLVVHPDILNKPGKPTEEEWEQLKRHPEEGGRLVAPIRPWLGEWALTIEQHHERFDGGGYPKGLAGHDISLGARIVAVADTYDVMTSVRSYKRGLPPEVARQELAACAGTQFDPAMVRAFMNISLGRLRWAMGPATWLAQLPFLLRFQGAGMQVVNAGRAAAAVTTLGVGGVAGGAVGMAEVVTTPEHQVAPATLVVPAGGAAGAGAADAGTADDTTREEGPTEVLDDPGETTTALPEVGAVDASGSGVDGTAAARRTTAAVRRRARPSTTVAARPRPAPARSMPTPATAPAPTTVPEPTTTTAPEATTTTTVPEPTTTTTTVPEPTTTTVPPTTTTLPRPTSSAPVRSTTTTRPANRPPVATGDSVSGDEDQPQAFDLRTMATDPDGDPLAFTVAQPPVGGAVTLDDGVATFTPAPDWSGTTTFDWTAEDADAASSATVDVTVRPVNDAPTFAPGPDVTVTGTGPHTRPAWATAISAGPPDEAQAVAFEVTAADGSLFTTGPAVDPTGTLTFTPAPGATGSSPVSVAAVDDHGARSAPAAFTIAVAAPVPAPTIAGASPITVDEDCLPRTIAGWVSATHATSLTVATDDTALFSTAPAVDGDGTLTFTPRSDAFGTADVVVTASGVGGTVTNATSITIEPVDDAPSFDVTTDVLTAPSGPGWSGATKFVGTWATGISAGPGEHDEVKFELTTANPGFFASGGAPTMGADGILSFELSSGAGAGATSTTVAVTIYQPGPPRLEGTTRVLTIKRPSA